MAALELVASDLISRSERSAIGERVFDPSGDIEEQKDDDGGLIASIWKGLGRLTGFIIKVAKAILSGIAFSFQAIWGVCVQSALNLYFFDWNQTDEELDQVVRANYNALGGALGGAAGTSVGYLLCGALPAVSIFAFNEGLGAYLLKEVGAAYLDEISGQLSAVVASTWRALSTHFMIWSFKNVRKWLKKDDNFFAQVIFGERYADIKKSWGEQNTPSWSFAIGVENWIESIKNPFFRAFAEEFVEEGIEACIEAGYVITGGIDQYIIGQKLAQQSVLGKERAVEVIPNRDIPEERIILAGPEEVVKSAITNALAMHTIYQNRDVGQIVGVPLESYQRATANVRSLTISWYEKPKPPWGQAARYGRRASYSIPDISLASLDWEKIKLAAGGKNGFIWGPFRATAKLSNGRQMACYGGSPDEAEELLRALASLSTADILTLNISQEKNVGRRAQYPELRKARTRLYPAYASLIIRRPARSSDEGRRDLDDGVKRVREQARIELWPESKPADFEEIIQSAISGIERDP